MNHPTRLITCALASLSCLAAEDAPTTIGSVPDTIRVQLVSASGGEPLTDTDVVTEGGKRVYVAHYRNRSTGEMRIVRVAENGTVESNRTTRADEVQRTVRSAADERPAESARARPAAPSPRSSSAAPAVPAPGPAGSAGPAPAAVPQPADAPRKAGADAQPAPAEPTVRGDVRREDGAAVRHDQVGEKDDGKNRPGARAPAGAGAKAPDAPAAGGAAGSSGTR